MTIKSKNAKLRKIQIDLTGSQGNAFFLIGTARQLGKQLGYDKAKMEEITNNMMSGDYENLVKKFEENFGDYVTLYRQG